MWMAVKRGIVVAIGLLIQILLTLFIYLKYHLLNLFLLYYIPLILLYKPKN